MTIQQHHLEDVDSLIELIRAVDRKDIMSPLSDFVKATLIRFQILQGISLDTDAQRQLDQIRKRYEDKSKGII